MKDKPFVAGVVIGALAVGLILLLSGSWMGMMGPGWNGGMMGPGWGMMGGISLLFWLVVLLIFLATLALWVKNSGEKKKNAPTCPNCGEAVLAHWNNCPVCASALKKK